MKTSNDIMKWVRNHNKIKGGIHNGQSKYTTYEMELHVPYSTYSEIAEKDYVWEQQKRHRRNCEETLRNEGSTAARRKSMCGSYPYACSDFAKDEHIGVYVISEREECAYVL